MGLFDDIPDIGGSAPKKPATNTPPKKSSTTKKGLFDHIPDVVIYDDKGRRLGQGDQAKIQRSKEIYSKADAEAAEAKKNTPGPVKGFFKALVSKDTYTKKNISQTADAAIEPVKKAVVKVVDSPTLTKYNPLNVQSKGDSVNKDMFRLLPGEILRNLPLGWGSVVQELENMDEDELRHLRQTSAAELVKFTGQGTKDTAKEFVKAPVRIAAQVRQTAGGKDTITLPVLGETQSYSKMVEQRVEQGVPLWLAITEQAPNIIFDTIFVAGAIQKATSPRQSTILTTKKGTPLRSNRLADPAATPKTFRQTQPTKPTYIPLDQFKDLGGFREFANMSPKFNPKNPTYAKITPVADGLKIDIIQVKPGLLQSGLNRLKSAFDPNGRPVKPITGEVIIETNKMTPGQVRELIAKTPTGQKLGIKAKDLGITQTPPAPEGGIVPPIRNVGTPPVVATDAPIRPTSNLEVNPIKPPIEAPKPTPISEQNRAFYPETAAILDKAPTQAPETTRVISTNKPLTTGTEVDTDLNTNVARGNGTRLIADIPNKSLAEFVDRTEKGFVLKKDLPLEFVKMDTRKLAETKPATDKPETIKDKAKVEKTEIAKTEETKNDNKRVKEVVNTPIKSDWVMSDNLMPGIVEQLESAQPGSRIRIEVDGQGSTPEIIGVPSTFPDWIPADLRLSSIVKPVAKHLREGTIPTKKKEVELYNYIAEMIDAEALAKAEVDKAVMKDGEVDMAAVDAELEKVNKLIDEAIADEAAAERQINEKATKPIQTDSKEKVSVETQKREVQKDRAEVKQPVFQRASESLGFNPKNISDPVDTHAVSKELNKLVKREEIAQYLSEQLGVPIRRGKFNRSALGIFKTQPKVIRLKGKGKSGGLPTVFHEVGHFIDDKFNFSKSISIEERKALMVEYGLSYEGQARKQQKEAFAEFLRYRMTGQKDRTDKMAPEFSKEFDKRMESLPEIKQIIETAADDYARWKAQPASAKVMSQIAIGPETGKGLGDRMASNLHELYTLGIDDIHPIGEFSKLAKERGLNPAAQNDPYKLARNLRGWIGRADTFLKRGTFGKEFYEEVDGKIVPKFKGKSFEAIVKPIEEAGNLNDFRIYIVSKRAVELADRKIATGISREDALAAMNEQIEKHPEFEQASADLYEYQNALSDYAYEHGLISSEGLQTMRDMNQYRVPFYRVMEEAAQGQKFMGKRIGNTGNAFKKIKGSDREIVDPIESIIKDTYAIINAADRNAVGVSMIKLANEDAELARLFEEVDRPMVGTSVNVGEVLDKALGPMADLMAAQNPEMGAAMAMFEDMVVNMFRPGMSTRPGDITIMLQGKPKVFHTDMELYKAMQNLEVEDVGMIMKIMSYPAAFLRAGATLTPEFIARNPLRDQFSAAVFSDHGFVPGVDLLRGMYEVFTDGNAYQLWKMAGGEHATMVSIDRPGTQKTLADLMASKGRRIIKYANPLRALQAASSFMEQATRIGEMRRALARTKNPTEAAFASREITLDFQRIGAKTRSMNAITAFWNANIQGTDKLIRAFKTNPRRSLFKSLLYLTLPSILLYLANRDDGRWEEIPQWQKNIFWIVLPGHISKEDWRAMSPEDKAKFLDENPVWRIPKPFVLGTIFGSVPERALENIDSDKPGMLDELMKSLSDGAAPGFIPTGLLPIIENQSNHSFFLDRDIVPQSKIDLPPGQQYTTYSSETSKVLGDKLGYSPAKIDNLIRGYFAGLGTYATEGLDKILIGTGIAHQAPQPAPTLADKTLLKAFVVRDPIGSASESVNNFYEVYNRADAGEKFVKQLLQEGKKEEAQQYARENPEIAHAKAFRQIAQSFSEMSKAKDAIMKTEKMSPEEKRQKIRKIDALQTDIAYKALTLTLKKGETK